MAWCAIIALHLARQDGRVHSESQENVFIIRWLATALKQHRFPREVAPDITWLLKQGRTSGVGAKMRHKLEYLWRSCAGELSEQNDLFRLTFALETAKDMHWNYRLLSEREWSGRHAVTLNTTLNGIFLSRSSLDIAFNDDGGQINPLKCRLTGNIAGLQQLFARCGWRAEACPDDPDLPYLYTLLSGNGSDLKK
ncbi:DUF2913 family protein [Erwinia endophytica]|uniref:DUF2913 family protein n=1 Tax=Erwinia endophytica TaxID=1563158 RepID=UPI001265F890|nr:DUF2913 family protein [Erwinia endophytica]KAB8306714.1 DUF2913 family protein [Erwinia endophytica]